MSVYDWIERYVPGGHNRPLGRLLDVPNNSGLSIFGESDERFHIDGGNEQLPLAITEMGAGRNTKLQLQFSSRYAKTFLTSLEKVLPGISRKWTGKASLSTPFLDPLLNCSYSYWRVGQYTSFGGYEGVALGNVHFAGEHTSQDFQGFMEGGASEGVRAADEVLAAI